MLSGLIRAVDKKKRESVWSYSKITEYWKSIVAVIVMGSLATLTDYGYFFTFLCSAVGAFLFSATEKHFRLVFLEFITRISMAAVWAYVIALVIK